MTFVSYAQNFEDVMLWRALSHVENGVYIDIGAHDPIIDSVSLAFHERGWRGIHVEPTHEYAELLRRQRSGDLVIQAAVGDGPPLLHFFETPGGGISTADPAIAARYVARGIYVREIIVPCIALSSVFDSCLSIDIHWLKIDTEGYELQILKSWGKSSARPWVVVIESTVPLTQIAVYETWEPLLLQYGYQFVYFDGLNRFYISDLHPELAIAFTAPPNVFDKFVLNGTSSADFHKRIEARYQEKIDHGAADSEAFQVNAQSEIDRLTKNLAASSKRLVRVRLRLQKFWQSLVVKEQAQADSLISEISSIREYHVKALSFAEAREQELATRLATSESLLAQRNAEIRLSDSLLNEYRKREVEASSARSELQSNLDASRTRVAFAEGEFAAASTRIFEMQSQIARTDAELHDTMKADRAAFEQTFALLKASLAASEQKASVKTSEYANIERHVQRIQAYSPIRLLMRLHRIPVRESHTFEFSTDASSEHDASNLSSSTNDNVTAESHTPFSIADSHPWAFIPNHQSEPAPMIEIQHANQLLNLGGMAFVNAAYESILGRAPDATGGVYYLRRLQTEQDRVQILYELVNSKEARGKSRNLQGLSDLILAKRLRRVFFIRWLQNLLGTGQQLTRIEATVAHFAEESRIQVRSMESQLAAVTNACEKLVAGLSGQRITFLPSLNHGGESLPAALDSVMTSANGSEAFLRSLSAQLSASSEARTLSKK